MHKFTIALLLAFSLSLISCDKAPAEPPDRLDLDIGGPWNGFRSVELRQSGSGHFEAYPVNDELVRGDLHLSAQQFLDIVRLVQPFEEHALPIDAPNLFELGRCEAGETITTDAGGMTIVWHRGNDVRIAKVDFGCDADLNAQRNRRLRGIFDDLGVPRDGLPDRDR